MFHLEGEEIEYSAIASDLLSIVLLRSELGLGCRSDAPHLSICTYRLASPGRSLWRRPMGNYTNHGRIFVDRNADRLAAL